MAFCGFSFGIGNDLWQTFVGLFEISVNQEKQLLRESFKGLVNNKTIVNKS